MFIQPLVFTVTGIPLPGILHCIYCPMECTCMYINYCNLHKYSRVPLPLSVDRLRALPGHLPLSRFTLYRLYLLYPLLRHLNCVVFSL
jgi:hypothetical protein